MNIHPLNAPQGPHGPNGVGQPSAPVRKQPEPAEPQADRVEISTDASSSAGSADGAARQHRLEALKDAISSGKYVLTDEAIARAIIRKASDPSGT